MAAARGEEIAERTAGNIADDAKRGKLNAYVTDVNLAITGINNLTNENFDVNFKQLPLIVSYQPRVGGKSRHKNKNKKNNKSRRRNHSKKQRK